MGSCPPCAVKGGQATHLLRADDEDTENTSIGGPHMTVMVVGARGTLPDSWLKRKDRWIYCTVRPASWDGTVVHTTRWMKNVDDPVWQEEAIFSDYSIDDTIEFTLWDADQNHESIILGVAEISSFEYDPYGFSGELVLRDPGYKPIGHMDVRVKIGNGDYPKGLSKEFAVFVTNPWRRPLGLSYDPTDGAALYICSVKSGLIQSYNKQANPHMQVLPGYFIVKVNEFSGNSREMLKAIRRFSELEIVVRRPEEMCVTLHALSQDHLGMEFGKKMGEALLITAVTEIEECDKSKDLPAATDWNDQYPENQIFAGDRIVAINGDKGKANVLLRKMKYFAKQRRRFDATIVRAACMP